MAESADEDLRHEIGVLLAGGLRTEVEPVPEDSAQAQAILSRMQALPADDLRGRLVLAGLTDHPHGEEQARCNECMYYLLHRRWCELPELDIPVESHWWCRLWRI